MKKSILALIIATSIVVGYIPTNATATTINNIDILKDTNVKIKYENGRYEVKNKTLKEDSDSTSAARSYVSKYSIVEISDNKITATIEFTKKSLMSNTKIKINGEEVEYTATDVNDTNLNLKFKLESLEDDIEVSTTINTGFFKMNVSFRVKLDITDIPVISDGTTEETPDIPEEKPEEVPPVSTPDNDTNKPADEEVIKNGKYTIENDTLHISKDEESMARKYLNTISDVEYKDNKIYLILKFTGKSMMSNHIIKVNGNTTNFDIVDQSGDNFYVKFELKSLNDNITVSTKVLGTMDVEFRVKLKVDTLKSIENNVDVEKPSENNNGSTTPQVPSQSTSTQQPQAPNSTEGENSTVYKVQNEILTDSAIGYTAARAAVNSTSYIEDIEGVKYITLGLSQLDVMSNIRVAVNGSSIQYEVVRKSDSNNTMDIRFKIPSIESEITITAFINMTGMDISFGLDLLENTMEVISKAEATTPLATPSTTTVSKSEDKKSDEKKEEVANEIEAKEYFKKYTIENEILSDSAMGRTMTRKYLDKISILEEIDGKLYLTIKFSGTEAMDNIRIEVNGQEVQYSTVASDDENGIKAFRFIINDMNDDIRVYMFIKAVKMNIDFGIDLLEDTKVLIDEGNVSDIEGKEDMALQTLMSSSSKSEINVSKIVIMTAGITTFIILALQGIIYSVIKRKRRNIEDKTTN